MPTLLMARRKKEEKTDRINLRVGGRWHEKVKTEADQLGLSVAAYLRLAANEKMERDRRRREGGAD
jgi:predicted DNA binding CopG/RHH family protein